MITLQLFENDPTEGSKIYSFKFVHIFHSNKLFNFQFCL